MKGDQGKEQIGQGPPLDWNNFFKSQRMNACRSEPLQHENSYRRRRRMRIKAKEHAEPRNEPEKLLRQETEAPEGPRADVKNLDEKRT